MPQILHKAVSEVFAYLMGLFLCVVVFCTFSEVYFQPDSVGFFDEDAEIVAEAFHQDFIHLTGMLLCTNVVVEFPFYHTECSFYVASFVVVF